MPKFKKNKANIKPVVATSSFPYEKNKEQDVANMLTPWSP